VIGGRPGRSGLITDHRLPITVPLSLLLITVGNFFHQLREDIGVMGGQLRHDLPIYGNSGFAEQTYKFGVRDAFQVSPGPDPGNPERTKIPFSQFTPPISLCLSPHDCPPRGTMELTSPAPESFSQFSDLFSSAMSCNRRLYSCHSITSLNIRFLSQMPPFLN
jgi:hypothetical protein